MSAMKPRVQVMYNQAQYWSGWCIDNEVENPDLIRLRRLLDAVTTYLQDERDEFFVPTPPSSGRALQAHIAGSVANVHCAPTHFIVKCARCGHAPAVATDAINSNLEVCVSCGVQIVIHGLRVEPTDAQVLGALNAAGRAESDAYEPEPNLGRFRKRSIRAMRAALRAASEVQCKAGA